MSEEGRAAPVPEEIPGESRTGLAAGTTERDPSPNASRETGGGRRRHSLRIPDDEITRPQLPVEPPATKRSPVPPLYEPSGDAGSAVLTPTRIISIDSEPPVGPAADPPTDPTLARLTRDEPRPSTGGIDSDEVEVRFDDDPGEVGLSDGQETPVAPAVWTWPGAPAPSNEAEPASPNAAPAPAQSIDAAANDGGGTTLGPAQTSHVESAGVVPPVEIRSEGAREPVASVPRRSDPPDAEIGAEDLLTIEPSPVPNFAGVPPLRPPSNSQPPAPPVARKAGAANARSPLVIVPPHVGSIPPQAQEGPGSRRKGRLWWEELFNDDYVRASERVSDEQVAREVHFIEESLGVERGGALLDLGCGTGRHAVELSRRGYEVVGFDLSLAMLARAGDEAQEREARIAFVQGDMREMTFDEQFDGVYCWNTSFGYFDEDKNAQVVDRIHRALKMGGLLLLDVVNRDFLIRQSPSLAWFEGDGCVCMDEMSVDFITSRLKVKRTMMLDDGRSREIEYSMRVYSLHELGRVLHEHGFKVREVSGRLATPGVFFGTESPRAIILAEKR